ncbi:MAG: hypothetical protein N2509_08820, partial [Treponemataceae bacterium]|nr:hypothetical protein [Treponemataceae bacterium]
STLITPAHEVMLTALTVEGDTVIVKGETKNFDMVQAIKNDLAKSKLVKTVSIGATNLVKQGEKVEFDMRLFLK